MNGTPRHRLRRASLVALCALGAVALPLGGYVGALKLTGNFHEVVHGVAYRSGQLNVDQLAARTEELGLRSVLNLRGNNEGRDWYDAEVAFCRSNNVAHYDLALSAGRDLTAEEAAQILEVLKSAPKPILIHCKDGADRAGLGSALFRFAVAGDPPDAADDELTIWYGHIPMITPHVAAMGRSFERITREAAATAKPE